MEHSTVAVHYFQQVIIEYVRGKHPLLMVLLASTKKKEEFH